MSKEELRHGGMNIPGIEKGCVINTQRTLFNYYSRILSARYTNLHGIMTYLHNVCAGCQ